MKIDWLDLVVTVMVGISFMVAAGKFVYAGIHLVAAGLDFILLNGLVNNGKKNN